MSVTLPSHSIEQPPIYINNWIADLLFAKEPSSEAKPSTLLNRQLRIVVNSNRDLSTRLDHKMAYKY